MTTTLAVLTPAVEALRPFGVHNESCLHAVELAATSHEDAVARYRQQFQTPGYACIRTSDAEVFFNLREGKLHLVHHTDLSTHPLTQNLA